MRYIVVIFLMIGLYANDDVELVKQALRNGLKPIPNNFEALLKVLGEEKDDLSKEKIILGKKLFFEKELSLGRDISCASCHGFDRGGADSMPTAIGHKNRANPFHLNSPTVFNTAFSKKFFWNGRSESLQDQAKGPMQAPFEMSITPELAEQRISDKLEYQKIFEKVYGKESISFENIADAISAYEKTIVTRGRFDEFLLGNFEVLSKSEKAGLDLFISKGCVGCHNGYALGGQVMRKFPLVYHNIWSLIKPIEVKALSDKYNTIFKKLETKNFSNDIKKLSFLRENLTDKEIELIKDGFFSSNIKAVVSTSCKECHINGSNKIDDKLIAKIAFPFENKGGFLGEDSSKSFRVPLLRNIVRTAPYFHNGSVEKLEDAIKLMGRHQSRAELKDDEVKNIVAFLKAVDGEIVEYEY